MRALTTATAAAVLGVDRKTFDNLVVRLGPDILPPGRQGVERRVPVALVEELMLCLDLTAGLALPARQALTIARQLMGRADGVPGHAVAITGHVQVGPFIQLGADLHALREESQRRCEEAIESVVRRPRGRPPQRRRPILRDLGDA